MFIHAEEGPTPGLADTDLVGFIRMGNDFTQNYYQIEIPLVLSPENDLSQRGVWPLENEIDIPLEVLQQLKARAISDGLVSNATATFFDVVNGSLSETAVDEFSTYTVGQNRVAIKGNPNFGDIRTLMVGVKNASPGPACGQVWFNELRLSDLDNEGGWAAILSMDSNIADFANVNATGRQSTAGFGTIEQGPNERSREDVKQYDVVTNINAGQLFPKKWGLNIPFNYAQSEEVITPQFDQQFRDIELDTRLENAQNDTERDIIRNQSEDYTKRKSINFIGVRKQRTTEKKPRFYDVENFTFNYSYNQVEHRDFEIERSLDQNIRLGANYTYNFEPVTVEPFKKNDSLFTGKYWKFLKDFNVNLLPTSFSLTSDINRLFNKQKFREIDLTGGNIGIGELFRRNYTFDFGYTLNYNLTKSLRLNFSANNNNIIRNYFIDDVIINGQQDARLDVWDGFFDFGDPNRQYQQLGVTYELPFNKIPTLSFLSGTYSYTGDFQWQKGSDLYRDVNGFDLGNTVQNSNTHNLNTTLDMNKLYRYLGLVKKPVKGSKNASKDKIRGGTALPPGAKNDKKKKVKPPKNSNSFGRKLYNGLIGAVTTVKRIQVNYTENNGTFLPGYLKSPGFVGTLKPTIGYTFGSQRNIRDLAARNGWLTLFPDFNQQYTQVQNRLLDISANLEPIRDLKIDLVANRNLAENLTENFNVERRDNNNDGIPDPDGDLFYNSQIQNTFGNFDISTLLIKTAFKKSDEFNSETFDAFRENRLTIANRLALQRGIDITNPANLDPEGFPLGYGKTNQAVLLPAFLSAYSGQSADKVKLGAFRSVPIPNWNLKYTGLMKLKWFKKRFKRFSVTHGYRSNYTINQFRTNLEGVQAINSANTADDFDTNGNFYNRQLFTNINLLEQFSPLVRLDFEMKNSIKILAELKKDRALSLSFDNNLLTEIIGNEYILGLGYRIKDVRINSKLAGPTKIIKSDLNMKADISIRDNKTIVRYLDLENNQITSGQTIWGLKYTADYGFSKNLTGIFYFDYTFSEYAISTAFPQTTIRSGITLRYNFGN